jgi:hypothetical protein
MRGRLLEVVHQDDALAALFELRHHRGNDRRGSSLEFKAHSDLRGGIGDHPASPPAHLASSPTHLVVEI